LVGHKAPMRLQGAPSRSGANQTTKGRPGRINTRESDKEPDREYPRRPEPHTRAKEREHGRSGPQRASWTAGRQGGEEGKGTPTASGHRYAQQPHTKQRPKPKKCAYNIIYNVICPTM
jgi:hypothetical protein